MREVDENSEPVAGADELEPRRGQTRPRVRRAGEAEGHTLAVRVRAAPDETDRPDALLVPAFQVVDAGDRLGSLEVEHGGENAVFETPREIEAAPDDSESAARLESE